MNSTQSTLGYYESIKRTTGEMLIAAQRGDWEELLRKETQCSELIEQLKASAKIHPLSADDKHHKMYIIRQVLADDAAIRNLLNPWIAEVGAMLQTKSSAKKAEQAYRSTNG
jgi:flagellar protein FliT